MAIPELTADGFSSAGLFDSSIAELRRQFGSFQGSDRRPRLFARFEELVTAMQRSGLFEAVVVDGSFVTTKTCAE